MNHRGVLAARLAVAAAVTCTLALIFTGGDRQRSDGKPGRDAQASAPVTSAHGTPPTAKADRTPAAPRRHAPTATPPSPPGAIVPRKDVHNTSGPTAASSRTPTLPPGVSRPTTPTSTATPLPASSGYPTFPVSAGDTCPPFVGLKAYGRHHVLLVCRNGIWRVA